MSSSASSNGQRFLALSCVGLIASLGAHAPAVAQAAAPAPAPPASRQDGEGTELKGASVTATAVDEEPGRQQPSPKAVRSVRDTPQTVTVLSKEVLEQQNLLSLKDALSTVPGITFGAGEGGSGYGDSITLRGYSANNDITIDGVRDSAQYSRSDTFNVEQIEVTNGASSVQNGAGAVGGNINIVTKKPLNRDQSSFQAGVGTDNYYRVTADINKKLGESVAVRLNAMFNRNDVPGRDVEYVHRWGVAPSVTIGLNSPTRLTLGYFHQEENNIPQFGVPYFSNAFLNGPLPGDTRSKYYGYSNIDIQRIHVNQANAVIDHDFTDKISLRNLSRWQQVDQFSRADGPEGTFCLASTKFPATGITGAGIACTPAATTTNSVITTYGQRPGYFTPSGGSRGNTRDTVNKLLYNQTDLKAVFKTGGIEHTLDLGVSLSHETYALRSGNSQRAADGTVYVQPLYDIYNPTVVTGTNAAGVVYGSNIYTGPLNFIVGTKTHGRVNNYAAYLFDAAKLSDHFELNAGIRYELNRGRSQSDTLGTSGATLGQVTTSNPAFTNSDNIFSFRVGAVYKPIEEVSLYVAYGNSKTPSQTTVNSAGACSAATCNVKPEGAKNYEVGVKAELFDGGLLATLAFFRNERDSYKVASGDPTTADQQLDGKSRVNGIAAGLSGHITPAWAVTANYTYLDSKLIRSVSKFCIAHATTPVTGTCTNSATYPDPAAGAQLTATPRHSGSIYTAYTLPIGLTLGYGATYQGPFALQLPSIVGAGTLYTAGTLVPVFHTPGYVVHNATITYVINKKFTAQVNVKNFTNKVYYSRIRSTGVGIGWATPGDARSAIASLTYNL